MNTVTLLVKNSNRESRLYKNNKIQIRCSNQTKHVVAFFE
jgi:hypothetical protein